MPLTTVTGGGLVAGAFGQPEPTTQVQLLRAICIAGKRVEPGHMALPKQLASMLIGANKAVRVAAPAITTPAPEQDKPAPTRVRKE